jgi:hypothetical protein
MCLGVLPLTCLAPLLLIVDGGPTLIIGELSLHLWSVYNGRANSRELGAVIESILRLTAIIAT